MNLLSRFFGRTGPRSADAPAGITAATSEGGVSLQVLFDGALPSKASALQDCLRRYHASLSKAQVEMSQETGPDGNLFGLAGWGKHVVRLVGFSVPMPTEPVETCVAPAHYPQALKARARSHASHLLMYYAGHETAVIEQYVSLAAVGGALSGLGASVILNEAGHTSFPAAALAASDDGDILELLRTLPLPILYCGLVKYEVQGIDGVWMRTHGAQLLGLPNFAVHADGHHQGQEQFDRLTTILTYLNESKAHVGAGHTMEIGPNDLIRLRAATPFEPFLQDENPLLVIDRIERR